MNPYGNPNLLVYLNSQETTLDVQVVPEGSPLPEVGDQFEHDDTQWQITGTSCYEFNGGVGGDTSYGQVRIYRCQ